MTNFNHMKEFKILLAVFLAVTFMGCDDSFLEEESNPNKLTSATFWQNEDDAIKGLVSVYATLQPSKSWAATYTQYIVAENYRSDELDWRDDVTSWIHIASFLNDPENSVSYSYWTYQYRGVFRANQCIENIPNIPEMNDNLRKQTIAEARFLRAYFYYKLMLNFGERIPLYKVAFNDSEDHYYPPQSAAGELFSFIKTELSEVQTDLPASYGDGDKGRATRWAAMGVLAKLYLLKGEFKNAQSELGKIISDGGFDLTPNYGDNFDGNHKNNQESILEIQFSGDRTGGRREYNYIGLHLASFNAADGGYEEAYPSTWLFDLLKKDTTASGAYGDRLYETIMFDDPQSSSFYYGQGEFTDYHRSDEIFWKKYVNWSPDQSEFWYQSVYNLPLLRYADVLLLYAEVTNELEGPTQEVFNYINKVRGRSHVVPIPSNLNQQQVREHLQQVERPCELALEGSRWYDLIRWGDVKETLESHQKRGAANFVKGKHELFPIPYKEMLLNSDWKQNSGFGK